MQFYVVKAAAFLAHVLEHITSTLLNRQITQISGRKAQAKALKKKKTCEGWWKPPVLSQHLEALRRSSSVYLPIPYPSSCNTVGWKEFTIKEKCQRMTSVGCFVLKSACLHNSFLCVTVLNTHWDFRGHSQNTSGKTKSSNGKVRFMD